jgi:hypothetical protein
MPKFNRLSLLLFLVAITSVLAAAQPTSTPAVKHYKADFVVKEIDAAGHLSNARSYSTILATSNQGKPEQIRSGTKVPIRASIGEKGDVAYQYIDIGVNLDCTYVQEIDQKLGMSIKAEVSNVSVGAEQNALGPLIRQFIWSSDVVVTPGTPTTVFSSDDVTSKTQVQLEITATLIK